MTTPVATPANVIVHIKTPPKSNAIEPTLITAPKGGRGKKSKLPPARTESHGRSSKAGIMFPVGRIERHLREGSYTDRVGGYAPVYLAAILEYLTAEILELAGNAAQSAHRQRIVPRHIQLAIRNDADLNALLNAVTISNGGVSPIIVESPQVKHLKKKKSKSSTTTASTVTPVITDPMDAELLSPQPVKQ
jgi:histone H2A